MAYVFWQAQDCTLLRQTSQTVEVARGPTVGCGNTDGIPIRYRRIWRMAYVFRWPLTVDSVPLCEKVVGSLG